MTNKILNFKSSTMKKKFALLMLTMLFVSASIAQNSLTIENKGYNAIYIELYVYEYNGWVYLNTYRIPGGSSVSFDIGNENYWDYGYKERDAYSNYISSFYYSRITLY